MVLKSFGCSFIFGTDLHDDGRDGPVATPSNVTYPALLAKKLDMEYRCHARPGAGNFEIANRVMNEIRDSEPSFFIINWTYIDRFSFINDKRPRLNRHNIMQWDSILPVDLDDRAKFYYKEIHTQLRDKIETLLSVKSSLDCLRACGIPFLMTWTDSLMWETQWLCPTSIEWLQTEISPYLRDFEGLSFLDWSRSKGFQISDMMHPLEPAHEAAANLLISDCLQLIKSYDHSISVPFGI